MKLGKSLIELATEIERQRESRVDYVAPTAKLHMAQELALADNPAKPDVRLNLEGAGAFRLNDLAHRQLGDHVGVPAKYYDRMRTEAPALLASNVNHWLENENENRMIRTLDGRVRAFLSDRYRPLENSDLAEAVLPVLAELDVEIVSAEITERRLYIKVVDKRINRDIPSGRRMGDGTHTIFDTISPAAILSNSEVGAGALSIEAGVWTRACTNMAIFGTRSMRKYHVGGRHEITDGMVNLLSDETKALSDRAVWAQVRDVFKGAFEQARFDASINEMLGMAEQPIEGDVIKVVDLAARHLDIQEGEKKSVLKHLIAGGDLTRYGLFNAVTRTAEDLPSYDRATEVERIGGKIIDLSPSDWRLISQAA